MEETRVSTVIQLKRRWLLGSQIGKGGFGRVFEALDEAGCPGAVKLIPKDLGASRELLFEDLTGVHNVVPIIDSGEFNGQWVLAMPRADMSLRAHLDQRRTLPPEEGVPILIDVATALADLQGRVVHRDVKPANALLLDGHWCLCDFGIARYAEASTSPDTHKYAWTSAYNPPERWHGQRATAASDIYSLGVMAFEMLMGHRPFPGPDGPDFRNQHLTEDPPALTGCPVLLASLVTECLLKAPEARPTAANLLARLKLVLKPTTPAASLLQAANQGQVLRLSTQTAQQSAARSAAEQRRELFTSATKVLGMMAEQLGQSIRENAPAAAWQMGPQGKLLGSSVTLGQATLSFGSVSECREDDWAGRKPLIDVVAYATIGVKFPPDYYEYEGRSHSLWFCDAQEQGVYGWYETAFMVSAVIPKRGRQNPFALPPSKEAGGALSRAITPFDVAWPFTPIEPGNDDEFLERWMTWFGQAAQGNLRYPSTMPERNSQGSWRL